MLAKRHANPFIARKIPLIGGLFCMAVFTALIAVVDSVWLTLVCAVAPIGSAQPHPFS
jgi:hypothetical protein